MANDSEMTRIYRERLRAEHISQLARTRTSHLHSTGSPGIKYTICRSTNAIELKLLTGFIVLTRVLNLQTGNPRQEQRMLY